MTALPLRSRQLTAVAGLIALVAFPPAADAARLRVTVVQSVNQSPRPPAAGAAVCLGTPANITEIGSRRADLNGNVEFDVTNVQGTYVLTMSGTGFMNNQQSVTLNNTDRMLTFALTPGTSGAVPTCTAGGAPPPPPPPSQASGPPVIGPMTPVTATTTPAVLQGPQIREFSIYRGNPPSVSNDTAVLLYVRSDGPAPTHFRVSETSSQFPEPWADWKPITQYRISSGDLRYPSPNMQFQNKTPGTRTVYLQLRNQAGALPRDSAVVTDTIQLTAVASSGRPDLALTYSRGKGDVRPFSAARMLLVGQIAEWLAGERPVNLWQIQINVQNWGTGAAAPSTLRVRVPAPAQPVNPYDSVCTASYFPVADGLVRCLPQVPRGVICLPADQTQVVCAVPEIPAAPPPTQPGQLPRPRETGPFHVYVILNELYSINLVATADADNQLVDSNRANNQITIPLQ